MDHVSFEGIAKSVGNSPEIVRSRYAHLMVENLVPSVRSLALAKAPIPALPHARSV